MKGQYFRPAPTVDSVGDHKLGGVGRVEIVAYVNICVKVARGSEVVRVFVELG